MASKLKVEELRNELAQRGLPTTGAKPTLVWQHPLSLLSLSLSKILWYIDFAFLQVRRLDSALREEKKQPTGASDGSAAEASLVSGKRKRKLIEEVSGMSVKQLREEAALRGVSTSGSKKDLLERLSEHFDDIPLGKGMSFHILCLAAKKYFVGND